jgi:hypothetical protein
LHSQRRFEKLQWNFKNEVKNQKILTLHSAGAAYGNGIYLGKNSSLSSGYMGSSYNYWKDSSLGSASAMALCEVIIQPSGYMEYDWGYVVTDESLIVSFYLTKVSLRDIYLSSLQNQKALPTWLHKI